MLAALALICGAAAPAALAEVPSAVEPGHVHEPSGLYQGAMHGYTPNTVTGGTVVDTSQLAKLIAGEHPLLLDVAEKDRKPPTIRKDTPWLPTHRSLPGAVFLQGGGKGTDDPAYADAFKVRVALRRRQGQADRHVLPSRLLGFLQCRAPPRCARLHSRVLVSRWR